MDKSIIWTQWTGQGIKLKITYKLINFFRLFFLLKKST